MKSISLFQFILCTALALLFAPKRGLLARRLRRWNNNPGSGNMPDNDGGNSSDMPVAEHDPVAGRSHLS